jgi:NAD(P)-dependent dehydrogenase (short-subunit alcohol dehydrogenase family)
MHKESAMKLHGGHVVVIGGSSGIGLATARLAREEGAEVTIAGRSQEILV